MKQKLSPAGRAALWKKFCAPSNLIGPDEQTIETMMQAKAVYFWEATAMDFAYADRLMREGLETLRPEPGWESGAAVLLVIANQSGGEELSLELMETLADCLQGSFPLFAFGTAFAELDVGTLRLVLAVSEIPVRAPEELTRFFYGPLRLLAGGSKEERNALLGDCISCENFLEELNSAGQDGVRDLCARLEEMPRFALAELQGLDGNDAAIEVFSGILLSRFHNDFPTELSMQYIPAFLEKWFPLDQMRKRVLDSLLPPEYS